MEPSEGPDRPIRKQLAKTKGIYVSRSVHKALSCGLRPPADTVYQPVGLPWTSTEYSMYIQKFMHSSKMIYVAHEYWRRHFGHWKKFPWDRWCPTSSKFYLVTLSIEYLWKQIEDWKRTETCFRKFDRRSPGCQYLNAAKSTWDSRKTMIEAIIHSTGIFREKPRIVHNINRTRELIQVIIIVSHKSMSSDLSKTWDSPKRHKGQTCNTSMTWLPEVISDICHWY